LKKLLGFFISVALGVTAFSLFSLPPPLALVIPPALPPLTLPDLELVLDDVEDFFFLDEELSDFPKTFL
jgi:hypothetical protein